jgi:archaellum biogenesis ATPase FlaH
LDEDQPDHAEHNAISPSPPKGYRTVYEIPSIFSFKTGGIEFAIPGIIAYGAITMISGDAGCGKSSLVTYMAYCISNEFPCLGRELSETADCLYLDRENGISIIQERFLRLSITDNERFKYWADNGAGVGDVDDQRILDWINSSPSKKVLFIDSFTAFYEGKEIDPGDVRKFMNLLRKYALLGVAVVILHHTGKGGNTKEYRGSSDIKASIDVGYILTNEGKGRLTRLKLTAFKCRFTVADVLSFEYDNGRFTPELDLLNMETQLSDILQSHPGVIKSRFETLAEDAGFPRKAVRDFIESMHAQGKIKIEHGPKNSQLLSLTES